MDEEKKNYEIGFLLKSEDKKPEIRKIIESRKGEITEEGAVIGIKLAYPIKKETFAYFGYVRFLAEPSAIKEMDEEAKHNPALLRHLIVIYPAKKISKVKRERRGMAAREAVVRKSPSVQATTAPVFRKPRKTEALTNEYVDTKLEERLE